MTLPDPEKEYNTAALVSGPHNITGSTPGPKIPQIAVPLPTVAPAIQPNTEYPSTTSEGPIPQYSVTSGVVTDAQGVSAFPPGSIPDVAAGSMPTSWMPFRNNGTVPVRVPAPTVVAPVQVEEEEEVELMPPMLPSS